MFRPIGDGNGYGDGSGYGNGYGNGYGDGYGCQCGGATVAEMAEDEEQDDEMP